MWVTRVGRRSSDILSQRHDSVDGEKKSCLEMGPTEPTYLGGEEKKPMVGSLDLNCSSSAGME